MTEDTTRATLDEFDELHRLTCRMLLRMLKAADEERLTSGELNDEGKPFVIMPPPSLLAQALKFLKDNGIDKPHFGGQKKDALKGEMPTFEEDAEPARH